MKTKMTMNDVKAFISRHPEYRADIIDLRPLLRQCYPDRKCPVSEYACLDLTGFTNIAIQQEMVFCILACLLAQRMEWESLVGGYLYYVPYLARLVQREGWSLTSLLDIDVSMEEQFIHYITEDRKERAVHRGFLRKVRFLLHDGLYANSRFEKDIWDLRDFHLATYRYSKVSQFHRLDFRSVSNECNKAYLKQYTEECLRKTDISMSYLYAKFSRIRDFLRFLAGTDAADCKREIIGPYIEHLEQKKIKNNSLNITIHAIRDFYETGIRMGLWQQLPVYFGFYIKQSESDFVYKVPSDFVIRQIFGVLDRMDFSLAVFFLLLYFTGMRESEACLCRTDGLVDDGTHRYIRFYQLKMRKEVVNPVPEKMFQLLEAQRKRVLAKDAGETYLFPASHLQPITQPQASQAIREFIAQEDIREEDGSLYRFRAHSYRHGLAMRLLHHDVPLLMIQKLLHHNSPEMSLVYARLDEQTRKRHYLEFCDRQKEKKLAGEAKEIDDNVLWMRHMISQILPNGYCSLPVQLGKCPHANACLSCKQFRTSKEFLPVLRYQQAKLKKLEREYHENRAAVQWAGLQAALENLNRIIRELEEGAIDAGRKVTV